MMMRLMTGAALGTIFAAASPAPGAMAEGSADRAFTAERVFDVEYASNPQISPDGRTIVYVRQSMDRQKDVVRGDLWTLDTASGTHRPLVHGGASSGNPVWSPDGTKLLYTTSEGGKPQVRIHMMDTGDSYGLGQFAAAPRQAVWSPDGRKVAFSMFTPAAKPSFATPPKAPNGAEWSPPVKVFDDLSFRFDGAGFLQEGASHVYVLPIDGGSPRQLTDGEADFTSPQWLDDDTLLVVGNEAEDRDLDPIESEIYTVELTDLSRRALTTRDGPDNAPKVSPDGSKIAYLGYDDEVKSYQLTRLYVMDADGSNPRALTASYDRSITSFAWQQNGQGVIAQVENQGAIDLVDISLNGDIATRLTGLGGTSIGRPYAGAAFSVSNERRPTIAYTAAASALRPAEIAVAGRAVEDRVLTDINGDILPYLNLAEIEEFKVASSHDGREIEAWVALPPGFKADGSYPLILEIHGGPFTMYGPYFSSEIQRYAAEGYVTVYVNPRGSTGYGSDFAELIDLNYPGEDVDDLMSVVDDLIARNYVDEDRLFITGGSGGGILTAWIVGKTNRFAAAAAVKPVINWMTMALSADIAAFVKRHWIRAEPWSDPDAFLSRSPITLIDDVTTPTLLMVGEEDWRTPTWEAEQFYTALKLKGVDTALIRVPGSPHYIAGRPSRLIAKTDNIMGWFEQYDATNATSDADIGTD